MNGYMSDPANGVAGKAILIEGAAYETVIQVLTNKFITLLMKLT